MVFTNFSIIYKVLLTFHELSLQRRPPTASKELYDFIDQIVKYFILIKIEFSRPHITTTDGTAQ